MLPSGGCAAIWRQSVASVIILDQQAEQLHELFFGGEKIPWP